MSLIPYAELPRHSVIVEGPLKQSTTLPPTGPFRDHLDGIVASLYDALAASAMIVVRETPHVVAYLENRLIDLGNEQADPVVRLTIDGTAYYARTSGCLGQGIRNP